MRGAVRPGGVGPEFGITTRSQSAHRRWRRQRCAAPPRTAPAQRPSDSAPHGRGDAPRHARLPYLAGLDGLRALAVLAVFLYHHDYALLPGGFLGVDVFFVLSGYLITALLLGEWRDEGRIALGRFWGRRARRLLPALALLLAGLLGYAALVERGELRAIGADALASAGYVTNWWLIVQEQSYFESMSRPSLLQHLWSLAVEGQFYLLWPLVFVVVARGACRWLPLALLAATLASAGLMALLDASGASESRLYYGTDTRAAALLAGAALATVLRPAAPAEAAGRGRRWLPEAVGAAALVLLGVLVWRLNEFHPLLYRGGFLLVAVASAVAVAGILHPGARLLPAALEFRPLRWLGTRSYAVYLWHWPVCLLTRPHLDVPLDGVELLLLRLAVTLALAELSWRLVEVPARRADLAALRAAFRLRRDAPRAARPRRSADYGWRVAGGAAGATVAVAVLLSVAASGLGSTSSLAAGDPDAAPPAVARPTAGAGHAALEDAPVPATPDPRVAAHPTPQPPAASPTPAPDAPASMVQATPTAEGRAPGSDGGPAASTPETAEPAPGATPSPTPSPSAGSATALSDTAVLALGDSVMLGAAPALEDALPGVQIEAEVGLQAKEAVKRLRALRDGGHLADVVVIHIGTNGVLTNEEFEQMMEMLAEVRRVVVVNVKVPRPWEAPNNRVLSDAVDDYPNAVLVDWRAESAEERDYFWTDGVHLRPEGAAAYASVIAAAVAAE